MSNEWVKDKMNIQGSILEYLCGSMNEFAIVYPSYIG